MANYVMATNSDYTHFGKALETQFNNVFLAPCFHFSALTSFEATTGDAPSNELTEPLIP